TLPSSFESWENSGAFNPSLGLCWTRDILEWRSGAVECSLSAVLESEVPSRFFLSPRAAKGILRRAEKRGRSLPATLLQALEALAASREDTTSTQSRDSQSPTASRNPAGRDTMRTQIRLSQPCPATETSTTDSGMEMALLTPLSANQTATTDAAAQEETGKT